MQEQNHHQNGEHDPFPETLQHAADRGRRVGCLGAKRLEANQRIASRQIRKEPLRARDCPKRVGVFGARHEHYDGGRAVYARNDRLLRPAVDDPRKVAEAHVCEFHSDGKPAEVLRVLGGRANADVSFSGTRTKHAAGKHVVGAGQRTVDVEYAEPKRIERTEIRNDGELPRPIAGNDDAPDRRRGAQRGCDRAIDDLGEFARREHRRGEGFGEHGNLRRILGCHDRRDQIGRHVRSRRFNRLLHVAAIGLDAAAEAKANDDVGDPRLRVGRDALQLRHTLQFVLDRPDDETLHLLGSRTRVRRGNGDDRKGNRRKNAATHRQKCSRSGNED